MVLLEYNQNIFNYFFFEFWKRKNALGCLYATQKQRDSYSLSFWGTDYNIYIGNVLASCC